MKYILKITVLLISLLFFSACQETNKSRPYLMNQKGVNPNSLAYVSQDKALDRKNKIEMAQIAANSKIEVAKVESKKAVKIAQIDSTTQKDVTKQTTKTTLEISKMDTQTKDKQSMINLYIAIGVIIALLLGMLLWYKHKKASLKVKEKLEENRLKHELAIKEKELQEQRIQKVLDLAISGQLPQELQKDFINALTKQDNRLIESK
ncbi:MAG: hypothetical protein QM497_08245 [Sulfurimonas sp.]